MKKAELFIFLQFITFSLFAQIEKSNVSFFIDSTAKIDISEVFSSNKFKAASYNIPSLGMNYNVIWTKISVKNKSPKPQKIYAQSLNPYLDTVQFFVVKNKVLVEKSEKMGWWSILKNRTFQNSNQPFAFNMNANEEIFLLAKCIKTQGTVRILLQIDSEKAFFEELFDNEEYLGWFFGMGVIVIFLNFFLYILVRYKVYLFYAFYVFCQIFHLTTIGGIHPELYINGFLTLSGRNVPNLTMLLSLVSNMVFIHSYLRVKELQPPFLNKSTQIIVWIGFLLALVLFLSETKFNIPSIKKILTWVFTIYFWLPLFASISMISYAIFNKKERFAAIFYCIAIFPLLIIATIWMLGNMGLLPIQTLYRINFFAGGIAFEIILSCFWLANRFKQYADEQEILIQEKSKQQQIAIETGLQLQNQERSRLAKELHDGIGIDISIVKMKLEAIRMDIEKSGFETKEVNETVLNLDNIASEIRSFSHNLMPPDLENNGLAFVLQSLTNNLQKLNPAIEINFTTNIEESLPKNLSQELYFIAKELINNTLKHAHANIIDIELLQKNNYIELRISDNGKGYDLKNALKKEGLGLRNILSRVEFINGTFEVFKKPLGGILHQIVVR